MNRIFDSPWFYYTLALLLVVGAIVAQIRPSGPEADQRPIGTVEDIRALAERDDLNVIFVLIDTLRADRLNAYGAKRITSPVMDEMANRGIRFAHTESQSSWTKASMASLWTARYPERTGVQGFANALPEEAVMPAEIFRDAGFRTAGIWRNGWVANNFRFDQGFSLYVRPRPNRRTEPVKRHNPSAHPLMGTDVDATESAIEFIQSFGGDRFFLYLHYMDVHQYLYADISPDFGTTFSDFYDSSIYWVDHNVGYLRRALREAGIDDRTIVVIASDHGEAFFEHGVEGHAQDLYREVLEVPFIISLPFDLEQGIVVESRVANVDIFPTLLDLVGLPSIAQADGVSAMPLVYAAAAGDAGSAEVDRPIFAQLDRSWGKSELEVGNRPWVSIVKGPYRMIHKVNSPTADELYDRTTDPREQQNLAAREVEVVEDLRREVETFLNAGNPYESEEIEINELHRAQLRALGYMIQPKKKDDAADPEAEPGEAP